MKPSICLNNVPNTRDLSDELGFYGTEARRRLFYSSRTWRTTYTTNSGRAGTNLLTWDEELEIMAEAFLSAQTPDFRTIMKGDSMPYNSDKKIVGLLKQLFWRQNTHVAHYTKYTRRSKRRIRCISATEYNSPQIKRQKRAGEIIAFGHNRVMVLETEQSLVSQEFRPVPPPLAPLHTDAVALSPTESQPLLHLMHKSTITTQPKCRILIPFYVLLHSGGKTLESFWEAGRFGSKSLEQFLPDFAARLKCTPNDIKGIKIMLRFKTLEVEININARNETIWQMAINAFKNEIRREKTKGELKGVSVLLEPAIIGKDSVETGGWNKDKEF